MTKKFDFETIYVAPDYPLETLINGNVSECINNLRELIESGITGKKIAHEQLMKISEQVPERYQYIKEKVFSI